MAAWGVWPHGRTCGLVTDLILTSIIGSIMPRHAVPMQEVGSGHHSPIGAYNEEHDAVLVMDVSRYK